MATHDYNIANQGFPAFRSDLNNALSAIVSNNSNSSAPSTTYAYQWWYDVSTTTLKFRNADNDAWISFATFDMANDTVNLVDSAIDVVTDTSPQLGGNLDTNGNNVDFGDSDKARFGASQDLEIYHDGSNSIIKDEGTGNLILRGTQLNLKTGAGTKSYIECTQDTDVALFYNNSEKLTTTNTGIDVTGEVLADKAYIAEATLTDGATISWDMSTQSVAKVTLGGNRTLSAPTNSSTGQFCSLNVIQDSTGSRTLTWNAVFEFASDTAPTLTTTGSKGDLFVFRYNGSKWLEVGRNLNISQS